MTHHSSFEHRLILLMKIFQAMRHSYESHIYACLLKAFEKWHVHSDTESLYNILSLHVLLLEENCSFRKLLYEHYSRMLEASFAIGKKSEQFIQRYRHYMELSQKELGDSEIYEKIFKLENPSSADKALPAKERKSWNARMRKWKHDNKEILQNGVAPAVLPDLVAMEWKPAAVVSLAWDSLFWHLLNGDRETGRRFSSRCERFFEAQKQGSSNARQLFEHLFLTVLLCNIRYLKKTNELYDSYVNAREQTGFLIGLTNPREAKEIIAITTGAKVKTQTVIRKRDSLADHLRAIYLIHKNLPDVNSIGSVELRSSLPYAREIWHTLKKRIEDGLDPRTRENGNRAAGEVEYVIRNVRSDSKTVSTIRTWNDVLLLLMEVTATEGETKECKSMLLESIFLVCEKRNGWGKFTDRTNGFRHDKLQLYFERWQVKGFFDLLYARLSKSRTIPQLKKLRWHKVTLASCADFAANIEVYSPFWEPQKKV